MIINVGDYWIDSDLLIVLVILGLLFIGGIILWWVTRPSRANKAGLAGTHDKTSALPTKSGLRGGR
jgi:hypothetical protein